MTTEQRDTIRALRRDRNQLADLLVATAKERDDARARLAAVLELTGSVDLGETSRGVYFSAGRNSMRAEIRRAAEGTP